MPNVDQTNPLPVPSITISKSAIVMIKNEPYKYLGETVPGRVHLMHRETGLPYLQEDENGAVSLLTQIGWDDLVLAGELQVVEPPSKLTARMLARMAEWDSRDIIDDPLRPRQPGEALPLEPDAAKMLAQVLLLDEHGVPNGVKAIEKALAKRWKGEFVTKFGEHDKPITIKRWRSERGTPGNRLLSDFIRMSGRVPRKPYGDGIPHEIVQIMCLRARMEPGTTTEIHDQVGTMINEINNGENPNYAKPAKAYAIPSESTVYRAWRALENSYTVASREGIRIRDAEWRGAGRPLVARYPFQYGIMDHTRLPMVAVFDIDNDLLSSEVWLTTLIDVYSRVILGWVITVFPPSLWTVTECIRRANLPKRPPPFMAAKYPILRRLCGKTSELIVDNGREFRGHGLENAAAGAGFAVRFAPIKKPTYKGVGERFFGTVLGKLTNRLPGKTIPIARTRKAEYDAKILAVVTLDDLEALMNQAIAEYHTEGHGSLMDRQPALVFQKGTAGGIDVIHDMDTFLKEVMAVILDVQLDKAGITRFGLRYFDVRLVPELLDDLIPMEPRRQRRDDATVRTKIKYNPMDIGRIHVWNRKTRRYVTLVCEFSNYAEGMPLELHKQIQAQAEFEAAEFSTEADCMAARTRRIDAIRAIDTTATRDQKQDLATLMEIPRIRAITGNIVDVNIDRPVAVSLSDFIAHDMASATSLDAEINAPRKPFSEEGSTRKKRVPARDRRDAGKARPVVSATPPTRKVAQGRSRRVSGDYN